MLDLAEAVSPITEGLPLHQVIDVMHEQQARAMRQEIYQHYMGNLIPMLAGKDAKRLGDVYEDYERLRKGGTKDAEVEEAYSVASDTLKALEKARNGVM